MPVYCVQLNTDTAWAETEIEADDLDAALAQAFELDSSQLAFEFFSEPLPIVEIAITDPDGSEWTWRADELRLRLTAGDLLIAAKNLLTALELWMVSEGPEKVVRSCASHLREAVDRAEGRRA